MLKALKNALNNALKNEKNEIMLFIMLGLIVVVLAAPAFAQSNDLPWNKPLEKLVEMLSGWQAVLIGVLAIVIGAAMLIMQPNGDWGQIFKVIGFVVVCVGLLTAAMPFLKALFGKSKLI